MRQNFLKVKEENWSRHTTGDWASTEWHIYKDGSIRMVISFVENYSFDLRKIESKEYISLDTLNTISKLIEEARAYDDKKVVACDGTGYEFELYDKSKIVWKREWGHIYGISPLEKVIKLLPESTEKNV